MSDDQLVLGADGVRQVLVLGLAAVLAVEWDAWVVLDMPHHIVHPLMRRYRQIRSMNCVFRRMN